MSITIILIIITAIVSIMAFNNAKTMSDLWLFPAYMKQSPVQFYRLITSGFVHADYAHLAFNMITFYFFGRSLEQVMSIELFIIFYLSAIIVANIPSSVKHQNNPQFRSLGASGGVSAVLFAVIYLAPWGEIGLIILPGLRIPNIVFAILYLGYTIYMSKRDKQHINHDAHLWGALYGLIFMLVVLDPTHGKMFINQILGRFM